MMRVTRREQMLLITTLLLLLLVGLCTATEYYVKPTISQVTSCPRESCYTLDELAAKYFYASATDVLTDNVTVIFLNGTHELKGSIIVREVNDFTLLSADGMNVEINCKGVSSLAFGSITNLTITRITFSQCGAFYKYDLPWQAPHINALIFSDVFNLRLSWLVVQNSTDTAILAVNLMGASVIDHSVFESFNDLGLQSNYKNHYRNSILYSHYICIWYENCNRNPFNSHNCSNSTQSLLHSVNSHKLHIRNCVLRDGSGGSMRIILYHEGYKVEVDLMNITALNGGGKFHTGDISIHIQSGASDIVTIRDSYIGSSKGAAISVSPQETEAYHSQLIHITNSIIDRSATGIDIFPVFNSSALQIIVEDCIIMNITDIGDKLHGWGLKVAGSYAKEDPQFSMVFRNVSFENNKLPQKSVISLYSVKEIELIDCRFVRNQGTPITLYKSTLKVSGTLSFMNNTAYQGGAMAFYRKSYMSVSLEKNTEIVFTNNYAEHVGGAIFADETAEDEMCFLQLATHNSQCSGFINNPYLSFVFTNNTAYHGGDAIYGGSLQHCIAGHCKGEKHYHPIPIVGAYVFIMNYWNLVQYDTGHHSNLSLISSAPSRVCLCEDERPDCLTMFINNTRYPGETFSISAVAVGQGFGTADGTVYTQFTNKDSSRLEELQQSQQVEHNSCAKLKYTIFSANEKEAMVLSTHTLLSAAKYNPEYVGFTTKVYELIKQNPYDVYHVYSARLHLVELLGFKIFINITLLPCPLGFMLSDQPAKCVCHTTLQLHNVSCNIDNQTVHREGTVWVNASFAGNKSNGVIVHHHCPYGYCNTAELYIRLDSPDTQCNFNHSGILCGGCRQGLSLTLGTSQCLRCSNKYIALLIPFAIAGIVLVAFIKLFNLTVSEGTLNGLIFYANIIGANEATFFPSTHCPVLTVFIAWLNLDLGIETCFIDGLNGYWKTWLQFVFPAYIWIITAVMIIASHYSSTGARIFGTNSVQVLATLFLLSYTKLLRAFIVVISFTFLDHPDDTQTAVWLYDGNIQYLSPAHIPLFLVALTVFFILWLPYTLVLLLMQCIRKKTHHRTLRFFARKKPLFDAYLGPFKDKHCYWVGVMLLMRALLLVIHAVNPNNAPKVNLLVIGIVTFGLVAYTATVEKVYKKWYLTFLENSFLFNLGVLALGTSYTSGKGKSHTAVVHTLVGIAFLQFIGIIIFHACQSIKKSRTWRNRSQRLFRNREQNEMENVCLNHEQDEESHGMEGEGQARRLKLSFNELREPVLEYADDDTVFYSHHNTTNYVAIPG